MLSPTLIDIHHDTFIHDDDADSTVRLDAHRAPSDLDELDLGDNDGER